MYYLHPAPFLFITYIPQETLYPTKNPAKWIIFQKINVSNL